MGIIIKNFLLKRKTKGTLGALRPFLLIFCKKLFGIKGISNAQTDEIYLAVISKAAEFGTGFIAYTGIDIAFATQWELNTDLRSINKCCTLVKIKV